MARASARPVSTVVPCAVQYCRSMAIAADPQPSSVCFTKGTSSQIPGASAGAACGPETATRLSNTPANNAGIDFIQTHLVNPFSAGPRSAQDGNQGNDQNRDDDNDQQVAVG